MRIYFEEIRGSVLQTIPELYNQILDKLPHSDDPAQDRETYINIGRQFLMTHTCDSIYFGRWVTEFNDSIIDEGFRINKKKRPAQSVPPKKRSKKCVNNNN
jgi:hypothetical protein